MNGDVRFAQADLTVSKSHLAQHRHALRLDRAEIDGSLSFGGKGGERDQGDGSGEDGPIDDSAEIRIPPPRLRVTGAISLASMRVNGYVSIESAYLASLSAARRGRPDWSDVDLSIVHDSFHASALEAEQMVIGKGLYFSNRQNHTFICCGRITLSGSDVGSDVSLRNTIVLDLSAKSRRNKGAVIAEYLTAGANFDVENCAFIGGMHLTQVDVAGTAHLISGLFAATELAASSRPVWRADGFDLTNMEPGEVALSVLRGSFGRSLKIREGVHFYGILNLTATRISNDLEFWLKNLRQPDDLRAELDAFLETWKTLDGFATPRIATPQAVETPSILWAQRADVGGIFHLGHAADPDDTDAEEADASSRMAADMDPSDAAERICGVDSGAKRGYMNFTEMTVNTLRDSRESWPEQGRLVLSGFSYDRFDPSERVPWDPAERVRWLRLTEPKRGLFERPETALDQLFDQLFAVYRRMGMTRDAEYVHYRKYRYRFFKDSFAVRTRASANGSPRAQTDGATSRRREPRHGIFALLRWAGWIPRLGLSALVWVLKSIIWVVYGWGTYFGYRPARFVAVLLPWFLVGLVISHSAYNPVGGPVRDPVKAEYLEYTVRTSCLLPASEAYYFNFMDRARQSIQKQKIREDGAAVDGNAYEIRSDEYLQLDGFPHPNIFLYTLDSIIPLDLGIDQYWRMSDEGEYCNPARLHLSGLVPGVPESWHLRVQVLGISISFRFLHVLFVLIGYVFVGVLIAAASGLIRPSSRSELSSRRDNS